MYKILIILCFVLGTVSSIAQTNESLADDYYKRGEFQKALVIYQNLNKEKPYSYKYIYKLVETYQQLEQFDDAQNILIQRLEKRETHLWL